MQRFSNLNPAHRPASAREVFRWAVWDKMRGRRRIQPAGLPADRVQANLVQVHNVAGPPQATWIGHSSWLLSLAGHAVLTDPVFAERVGVLYSRHVAPGLLPEQLPPLDAVLLSHNHYDHLDLASLRAIDPRVPLVIPDGLGGYLRRKLPGRRLIELNWWEATTVRGLRITFVPARHWSRRIGVGRNCSLWGGFVLTAEGISIYYAGDSAWFEGFAEIGRRFPDINTAFIPIGAYTPGWFMEHHHLNPEQAGEAFVHVGARRLVPIHWGTFQMADESLREPIERLQIWWESQAMEPQRLLIPQVGGTQVLTNP